MFGAVRYNWSCEIYVNNLVMINLLTVCDEQYVYCVMNKLSFEMNNCDLVYIYVISVRFVYIYL